VYTLQTVKKPEHARSKFIHNECNTLTHSVTETVNQQKPRREPLA